MPEIAYDPWRTLLVGPFSEDVTMDEVLHLVRPYRIDRSMIIPNPNPLAPKDNPFVAFCALIEFRDVHEKVGKLCTAINESEVYLPKNRNDGFKFGAKFMYDGELKEEWNKAPGSQDRKPIEIKRIVWEEPKKQHALSTNQGRNTSKGQRQPPKSNTGHPGSKENIRSNGNSNNKRGSGKNATSSQPQPQHNHNSVSTNTKNTRNSNNTRGSGKNATGPQPQLNQKHDSVSANNNNTRNSNNTRGSGKNATSPQPQPQPNHDSISANNSTRKSNKKRGSRNGAKENITPESLDAALDRYRAAAPKVAPVVSPASSVIDAPGKKGQKNRGRQSKKSKKNGGKLSSKALNEVVKSRVQSGSGDVANASVGLEEGETVVDEWAEAEVETDGASDAEVVVEANIIVGNEAALCDVQVEDVVALVADHQCVSADIACEHMDVGIAEMNVIVGNEAMLCDVQVEEVVTRVADDQYESAGDHIEVVVTDDCKCNERFNVGEMSTDLVPLEQMSEIKIKPSETTRAKEETPVSSDADGVQDVETPGDMITECEVVESFNNLESETVREVAELVAIAIVDEESEDGESVREGHYVKVKEDVVEKVVILLTEVEGDVEMEAVAAETSTRVVEAVTGVVHERIEGGEGNVEPCDDIIEEVDIEIDLVEVVPCKGKECGEVEEVSDIAEEEEEEVVMMQDHGVDSQFAKGIEVEDVKNEVGSESTKSVGGVEESAIFKGGISVLGFRVDVQVACPKAEV
ncbi:hypothetical protein HDU76_009106, partial [Blyttiomyces sp. JEL0837]